MRYQSLVWMVTDSDVVILILPSAAAAVAPAGLAQAVPGGAAGSDVIEGICVIIASVVITCAGLWAYGHLEAWAAAVWWRGPV